MNPDGSVTQTGNDLGAVESVPVRWSLAEGVGFAHCLRVSRIQEQCMTEDGHTLPQGVESSRTESKNLEESVRPISGVHLR